MSRLTWRVLGALSLSLATAIAMIVPAANAGARTEAAGTPRRPSRVQVPARPVTSADIPRILAQSAAGRTIPLWSGAATYQGVTYPYHMVGKNPFVHQGNPRVLVDTPVISVVLHFADGTTSDPTKPTGCGTSTSLSPRQLVAGSPIFQTHSYTSGGVFVGRGQYVGEFQRANFWKAIQASNNRDYAVRLRGSFSRVVTLSPAQTALFKAVTDPPPLGRRPCGHVWALDALALDKYLQTTLIPSLHLRPRSFPIFLGSNISGYVGAPGIFDVAGSHGTFIDGQGMLRTYAEVNYDSSPFGDDVSTLAHEVGEWMDDPLNDNLQPCYDAGLAAYPAPFNGLEVGDPLVGSNVAVGPMPDGVTYHPQELAFLSWFYNQVPSQAVNPAWYSSNGTFTHPGPLCTTP